jgi:DNA-damage-inducible protein D
MDKALDTIQRNLESIKRVSNDQDSIEFWSARDLMPMLGYTKWQKFIDAIDRAKEACKMSNHIIPDHFTGAGKMILIGSGVRHHNHQHDQRRTIFPHTTR